MAAKETMIYTTSPSVPPQPNEVADADETLLSAQVSIVDIRLRCILSPLSFRFPTCVYIHARAHARESRQFLASCMPPLTAMARRRVRTWAAAVATGVLVVVVAAAVLRAAVVPAAPLTSVSAAWGLDGPGASSSPSSRKTTPPTSRARHREVISSRARR